MNTLIDSSIKMVQKYTGHTSNGWAARFVPINADYGLKFFYRKHPQYYAEKTHDLQNQAANHGFAPKVSDMFRFRYQNEMAYGYITERIAVLAEDYYTATVADLSHNAEWGTRAYNEASHYVRMCLSEVKTRLMIDLENIGLQPNDMHGGNYGWMKDSRVVAIDFSHFYDTPIVWTYTDCGMCDCVQCKRNRELQDS